MKYTIAPLARIDLIEIWKFIAEDDPTSADSVIADLYKAFDLITDNPRIGKNKELLKGRVFRFWTVHKNYQIIYRETVPIKISRVISGHRDVFTVVREESI